MFLVTILVVLLYVNIQRYGIADQENTNKKPPVPGVELILYKDSVHHFITNPLYKPQDILRHVNKKKNWVFITFGLNESPESPGVLALVSALITTHKYNVVVLDWSRWAKVGPIGQMTQAMFVEAINNIQRIACDFGLALVTLNKTGLDIQNRTAALVGHSLGAQMMAEACACAAADYLSLKMIWALDPAGGLYDQLFGSMPHIHSGVTENVYVLHTDPDGFGTDEPTGTVDFWPNYSRDMYIKQPGCQQQANKDSLDDESLCNHDRSWHLLADGVRHPDSMPAVKAFDGEAWLKGSVQFMSPTPFIRLKPVEKSSGQHFLKTNELAPFGLKMNGTVPVTSPLFWNYTYIDYDDLQNIDNY